MEGNICVTYYDNGNRHTTITYDAVRMELYRRWDKEMGRFKKASKLFNAPPGTESDIEITMYFSVILAYKTKTKGNFEYSGLLYEMADAINSPLKMQVVHFPVAKIVADKRSLRGGLLKSKLVDLVKVSDCAGIDINGTDIMESLEKGFPYLSRGALTFLAERACSQFYPATKRMAPIFFRPNEGKRILDAEREEMLRKLRAANRRE